MATPRLPMAGPAAIAGPWPRASRLLLLLACLVAAKALLFVAASMLTAGPSSLCQFDCVWYVHAARDGYDAAPGWRPGSDMTDRPFFPLFPLLTRLVMVTGAPAFWSATLVANLALVAGLAVMLVYRQETRHDPAPNRAVFALLLFPYSLYLSIAYTESLYFLLLLLALLARRRLAPIGTGVATALLTATRPTGVLLIPYLAIETLWRGRRLLRPPLRWPPLANLLFPLALMPLGLALFMAYLAWRTGDALAFSHALAPWGRHYVNPIKTFYWNLRDDDWAILLREAGPESRSYQVIWMLPAALGTLWLLWRRLPFEAWTLAITTIVALSTGAESLPRYVGTNPVFLLLVGDLAARIGSRPARWALAALSAVLQAILLHRFLIASRMMM